MEIINWAKAKIKNLNGLIDVGVIISILGCVIVFFVFMYKLAILKIIGVPLVIAVDFIDIRKVDFIMAFIFAIGTSFLTILSYYTIYKQKNRTRIKNVIICAIFVGIFLKITKHSFFTIAMTSVMGSLFYLGLSLAIHGIVKRPGADIVAKVFKSGKEHQKYIIAFSESVAMLLILIAIVFFSSNIYYAIGLDKKIANGKMVLSSSSSSYLVAEYKSEYMKNRNIIELEIETLEIIPIEGAKIKTLKNAYFI